MTPEVQAQYEALNCTDPNLDLKISDDPSKPLVTCSADRAAKYILGPVEITGVPVRLTGTVALV